MPVLDSVYISSFKRSPIGAFMGGLAKYDAIEVGAEVLRAFDKQPQELIVGCVLSAGLGQSPSRQLVGARGWWDVPSYHINKVCGSGLQAIVDGALRIQSGICNNVICGGIESMSNAPHFLKKARSGYRLGDEKLYDHILVDGLEDHVQPYKASCDETTPALMGHWAEVTAQKYRINKEDMHRFVKKGFDDYQQFKDFHECVPCFALEHDEHPLKVNPEKFAVLKSSFKKDGHITAASSSGLGDGAAFIELTHKKGAFSLCGFAHSCTLPSHFITAPNFAINNLLTQLEWSVDNVDVFEINEAFAVVPMVAIQELGIPREKINIWGGACVLAHPLGASGARIVVTLLQIMEKKNKKRGIASICIGGGEGLAVAIERHLD